MKENFKQLLKRFDSEQMEEKEVNEIIDRCEDGTATKAEQKFFQELMNRSDVDDRKVFDLFEKLSKDEISQDELDDIIARVQGGTAEIHEIKFIQQILQQEKSKPYEVPKRTNGCAVLYTYDWRFASKLGKTEDGVFIRKKSRNIINTGRRTNKHPMGTCPMRVIRLNQFQKEPLQIWQLLESSNQFWMDIRTKNVMGFAEILPYVFDSEDDEEVVDAAAALQDLIDAKEEEVGL